MPQTKQSKENEERLEDPVVATRWRHVSIKLYKTLGLIILLQMVLLFYMLAIILFTFYLTTLT